MLETDEKRAEDYTKVKGYIDRYHKYYIEEKLKDFVIDGIQEYADLYYKRDRSDEDVNSMNVLEAKFRKLIADRLKSDKESYKLLTSGKVVSVLLPSFLTDDEEKEITAAFADFTTYFTGFNTNRENMYSDEEKSTAVSYRCINDNLPKFLDNVKAFEKVKAALPSDNLEELNADIGGLYNCTVEDVFTVDYFSFVLSQSGIDRYNSIIGGYTTTDGKKIQGLNEYINPYNQKADKFNRIPKMKMLFKQILSDRESLSFIPEQFESDDEMLSAVDTFYDGFIKENLSKINDVFKGTYDLNSVYIKNGAAVSDLSQKATGFWGTFKDGWNKEYDEAHTDKQRKKADYDENKNNSYKKAPSFSLHEFDKYFGRFCFDIIASAISENIAAIEKKYTLAEPMLKDGYHDKKSFAKNDDAIKIIKDFLDSIKTLQLSLKPLLGSGKEAQKDELFYGAFNNLYDSVSEIERLYDKVRNYVAKKPYSTDKIKLNFDNPQLLSGWDKNKETAYRTVLLRKNKKYYLAIMDKRSNRLFENPPEDGSDKGYEKIECKLLPGPNKMLPKVFFAAKNIDYYAPSKEILDIRKNETFKKGNAFSIDDCHQFIDFFKGSINKNSDWAQFEFKFSPTDSYKDISEFYNEVKQQGYIIRFKSIPDEYIDELVDNGKLYLFQLYNKDFSEFSKGTPNMHTLYFKMLFDKRNLDNVVYQLNGGAEMFYRKPSIQKEDTIIHQANTPLLNKNPHNDKQNSTFAYELTKDKRFTESKFMFHLPIKLNFKASGLARVNDMVREELNNSSDNYVIGIDRGERNLLYICVINGKGEIVEQFSLNEIINSYNGTEHKTDYHALLDKNEKERLNARQEWTTINNIKELKEGYLSQVIHKICELVIKYNAIVVMEDLNSGFKNSRAKVEKQVYQKFEKMLTDKLQYLADKKADPEALGGLLNAYQLVNSESKSNAKQNGIVFYIPAWNTSKIDPTTGFIDILKPKYSSVAAAKEFIENFNSIKFNSTENYFEFNFDYHNFPKGVTDYKDNWTICTNGERIKIFRNPQKNGEFDNEIVDITKAFIDLFEKHGIDYKNGELKEKVLSVNSVEFFKGFMSNLALTLQMRNSQPKTDIDYLISPVKNKNGKFYCSNDYDNNSTLPANADANGAYNIARKGMWAVSQIKQADDIAKVKLAISNAEWLEFAQKQDE